MLALALLPSHRTPRCTSPARHDELLHTQKLRTREGLCRAPLKEPSRPGPASRTLSLHRAGVGRVGRGTRQRSGEDARLLPRRIARAPSSCPKSSSIPVNHPHLCSSQSPRRAGDRSCALWSTLRGQVPRRKRLPRPALSDWPARRRRGSNDVASEAEVAFCLHADFCKKFF